MIIPALALLALTSAVAYAGRRKQLRGATTVPAAHPAVPKLAEVVRFVKEQSTPAGQAARNNLGLVPGSAVKPAVQSERQVLRLDELSDTPGPVVFREALPLL